MINFTHFQFNSIKHHKNSHLLTQIFKYNYISFEILREGEIKFEDVFRNDRKELLSL